MTSSASDVDGGASCSRCGGLVDVVVVNNTPLRLDRGVACACGTHGDDSDSTAGDRGPAGRGHDWVSWEPTEY